MLAKGLPAQQRRSVSHRFRALLTSILLYIKLDNEKRLDGGACRCSGALWCSEAEAKSSHVIIGNLGLRMGLRRKLARAGDLKGIAIKPRGASLRQQDCCQA